VKRALDVPVPVEGQRPASDFELVITPHTPLNGVAPGQTAVVYIGTRVLGQCTIDRTVSAAPVEAVA
jgi:tRNA-specific 2-thiouridylase